MTCLLATPAPAQNSDNDAILTYKGADRTEKLIEGAKKEGQLVYYSAMIVNQALRPLRPRFKKRIPSSR